MSQSLKIKQSLLTSNLMNERNYLLPLFLHILNENMHYRNTGKDLPYFKAGDDVETENAQIEHLAGVLYKPVETISKQLWSLRKEGYLKQYKKGEMYSNIDVENIEKYIEF